MTEQEMILKVATQILAAQAAAYCQNQPYLISHGHLFAESSLELAVKLVEEFNKFKGEVGE